MLLSIYLVQVQATVVGFLASVAAVIFGWIPEGHFRLGHAVLLCASSVATAFIASLLLGMASIQDMKEIHSVKCCTKSRIQLNVITCLLVDIGLTLGLL